VKSGKSIIKARFSCIVPIFVLQCAFFVPFLLAQDVTWVTVEGTAPVEQISKEQARSRAIEDAMRKAVEEVVGANISAETLVVNLRLSGSILGAIPYGRLIDKEILEEGLKEIRKEGQEAPSLLYWVRMKAGVAEETSGVDPSFRLQASLNQSSFKDGDEMLIRLRPTKDCYFSVFNILEDEKVLRLIPNQFKEDNFLTANETFCFPEEDDKNRGIELRVHTPEDKDAVTESIYILALKQPFELHAARFQEGIYGLYNGQTAFMKDLIKEVVGIPLSERAEKLIQYQIRKDKTGASN
jgi:hypothetical protein